MKKIFTLLLSFGLVSFSFAQGYHDRGRDGYNNNRNYHSQPNGYDDRRGRDYGHSDYDNGRFNHEGYDRRHGERFEEREHRRDNDRYYFRDHDDYRFRNRRHHGIWLF